MTPAEELVKAADKLEEAASKATPGVWKLWGMEVRADIDGTSDLDTSLSVAVTAHETGLRTWNASYIAATYPPVGLALAGVLRVEARVLDHSPTWVDGSTFRLPREDLLTIARLINRGES